MKKLIPPQKDSRTNDHFWQTIQSGNISQIREFFEQHRNYLIKINGIPQIAWHFIFLGLDELAYSLLKKNSKDDQVLSLFCELYFNAFAGCSSKVQNSLERLNTINQNTHRACIDTITQRHEKAASLLSKISNESLSELPQEALFFINLTLIKDKQYERARFFFPKETTSNSYLDRYFQVALTYLQYKEKTKTKNESEILLYNLIQDESHCLINYYIYDILGQIYLEENDKDKAKQVYKLALEGSPPFYKILQKNIYRILWEHDTPLTLEEQLTGLFSGMGKSLETNRVWINLNGKFQIVTYQPNHLKGDYVDLMAGQLSLRGKKTWLTELQAHVLISVIKSGKTGIQISSICEELHFLNPTEKSIEAVISKLKYEELKISRSNNTISMTLSSNTTYVIPHNHRCYGILAQLQFKDFFKRTDIEELANLKKTVAAEMIKDWLTQKVVIKRPDISPYAYTLKSLPEK